MIVMLIVAMVFIAAAGAAIVAVTSRMWNPKD